MKTFEQFLTEVDGDPRKAKNVKIADTVSRIYNSNLENMENYIKSFKDLLKYFKAMLISFIKRK